MSSYSYTVYVLFLVFPLPRKRIYRSDPYVN
nr:MAG TPA: hypothetical protein [Caudoviricetes sp.]